MSEIATLVIGFFLGIVSKLVGDHLGRVAYEPKLEVDFRSNQSFVSRETLIDGNQKSYGWDVKIRVTNSGKRAAKNCRGFLVGFEQRDDSGKFQPIEGGEDSLQLQWLPSIDVEQCEGFDMLPGVRRCLKVLSFDEGSRVFNLGTHWIPHKLVPYLKHPGVYRFTILVSAEEVEAKEVRLLFDWTDESRTPKIVLDAWQYG